MDLERTKHLALVGRLTLNMASLNNEGTEGNAIQPRTATVVEDGKLYTVPTISGDMLKYWHAKHLSEIAQNRDLPLCENVKRRSPDPNRLKGELADLGWVRKNVNIDNENVDDINTWSGSLKNEDEKKRALEKELYRLVASECVVTDAHGLLITEVSPESEDEDGFNASVAVQRTGRVQVGYMVGRPKTNATKHHIHAKYTKHRTGIRSRESSSGEGQNLFTRPATSAEYAIVATVDLHGIGFNDEANRHEVDGDDLRARRKASVDALSQTLMNQPGANSSQQFPHVMGFEGAIVTSESNCPAPTVSAMREGYRDTLDSLVKTSNQMSGDGSVEMAPIESLEETVEELSGSN
jgi:CRISPR-associated protein Cst2